MGDRLLYGHLPQRCIRVLTVHATSRPETPIQGNLSVVTLESCSHLQFSALSYVWGEPGSQSHHILCNDIAVPVQPNLHSALHNLRATLGTFTIWIDALCINQEDEKEKEHQIPLMGEIYAESECVYVWLGTGNFQTKRAINFLRDPPLLGHFSLWNSRVELRHWVVLMAMMTYLLEGFRLKKALFPRYSSRKSDLTSKSMTRASIHDLSTLLDAEWLERMWTYQEILLASNPILVSGQEHLPWWPFSLSITFLEYSGCFNQSGIVSYAPLTGWYKIALARDYLRYIRPAGGRTHLFHERSPEDAPLSSYIKFIQTLVHFERKLVKICVVIPITSMLFLSIIVGLIGVTDWENYRRAQKNMEFAATYNNCISSMIEAILTAYTHTARAMLTAESPTTTGTPTVVSTTTSMATPIATNVLDLLDRLHESPLMKPTKLMGTALSEISPTVVSVVQSCQSGCLQGSITQGCFTSCIAGATAMPTLRTIAFEDADVIAHMPLSSYRARFWGVFIYVSVFMGFGLLALLLGEFRRGVSIRPISQPSETAIDLVDALLYRKCRLDHDKLFALRNVLQRLSRMHSPPPDYKRSLAKVFSELNMQLSEAMNCNQMLVIASIIPLKNHPSWMVDWSQKPDPFWLSGRGSSIRDIVSNHYLEKRNESSMPVLRTKRLGKKLRCQVSQVCVVDRCFRFMPTEGAEDRYLHRSNFNTGCTIAEASADVLRYMPNCKDRLRASLSRGAPGVPRADIDRWVNFLFNGYGKPEKAFDKLMRKPKLLQTQMSICNQFHRTGGILFMHKSELRQERRAGNRGSRGYYWYLFEICRGNVTPGDVLIEVPGASAFLIVSSTDQARVLSPAFVSGERMNPSGVKSMVIV